MSQTMDYSMVIENQNQLMLNVAAMNDMNNKFMQMDQLITQFANSVATNPQTTVDNNNCNKNNNPTVVTESTPVHNNNNNNLTVALNSPKEVVHNTVAQAGYCTSPKVHPFAALLETRRYVICGNLVNSLFGVVKLGWDRLTARSVTIKISRQSRAQNQMTRNNVKSADNVFREAIIHDLITRENHEDDENYCPYLCEIVESFSDDFYHYIITEFNPAGDLYNQLTTREGNCLEPHEVRLALLQLVDTVQWMHSRGIVHSDISVENLCFDEHQNLKLIDFGIATLHPMSPLQTEETKTIKFPVELLSEEANTSINQFLCKPIEDDKFKPGKIGYMSPELINGIAFDAYKNDIWCIGVTAYTLAAGHPPFKCARHSTKDPWFQVISTGTWLNDSIRLQPSAHVYRDLDKNLLDLIDKILKPEPTRLTLQQITEHPYFLS